MSIYDIRHQLEYVSMWVPVDVRLTGGLAFPQEAAFGEENEPLATSRRKDVCDVPLEVHKLLLPAFLTLWAKQL